MPIYRYRCYECQVETEKLIYDVGKRNYIYYCECGGILKRIMASFSFKMAQTSRGLVTDTLNREYKTLPPEQVALMAPGLNTPDRPVIGTGFGGKP